MRPDDERHGTYAGWGAHRTEGSDACDPCRAANTAYMREFRSNPARRARALESSKATNGAVGRLVAAHRDEFDRLYAEELAAIRRYR